ncbi:hypothetical protein FKM82_001490, partial [Ascaphus truei]
GALNPGCFSYGVGREQVPVREAIAVPASSCQQAIPLQEQGVRECTEDRASWGYRSSPCPVNPGYWGKGGRDGDPRISL